MWGKIKLGGLLTKLNLTLGLKERKIQFIKHIPLIVELPLKPPGTRYADSSRWGHPLRGKRRTIRHSSSLRATRHNHTTAWTEGHGWRVFGVGGWGWDGRILRVHPVTLNHNSCTKPKTLWYKLWKCKCSPGSLKDLLPLSDQKKSKLSFHKKNNNYQNTSSLRTVDQ